MWHTSTSAIRTHFASGLILLCGLLCNQPALGTGAEPLFEEVLSAIVGVEAEVPPDARTAESLGTSRSGTGVVIDGAGLIVTIGYLILEAREVAVTSLDGKQTAAKIVAYDYDSGFGLLRAELPEKIRPMPLGDSSGLDETDPALILAFGGAAAVQPAVVISRRPFAGYWEYLLESAIYTAPPFREFGGAALVSAQGELLGIGSLVVGDALEDQRSVPGNMFVPIDELKPVLGDLLASGRSQAPPRPWLGIYSEELQGRLVVTRLADGGPAAQAGVEPGDIIAGVEDQAVESMADFYRKLWALGPAGTEINLVVFRNHEFLRVTIRSADRYDWLRL